MGRLRYRAGIGTYLALGFCGLATALSIILAVIIGNLAATQAKNDIGSSLASLARQTADNLDRGMQERYREVELMARRPDLTAPGSSGAVRRAVLDERQATFPHYAWIGMTGLDGRVIVATQGMLEGADVSGRPWFRNALAGIHVGDVHEAKLLAKLLPSVNGEPKRFVDIAFPYKGGNGEAAGVLGVHLSWEWAREVRDSVIQPAAGSRSLHAMIADAQGAIKLGPPGLAALAPGTVEALRRQAAGYLVEDGPEGSFLVGYARTRGRGDYPGLGWSIVVRQDVQEAYERVRSLQQRVMLAGVVAAVLSSLLGYFLARRLARPLRELAASAQRINKAEARSIPLPKRAYAEVQALALALNGLVSGLLQRTGELDELNQTLEQRVAERSSELARVMARAHADELRVQTIIDSAPDAFISVDLEGRIRDWNPAAQRTFGWRHEEVAGRNYVELLIPPRFRDGHASLLRALDGDAATLPRRRFEWLVLDRRGVEIPVEVTVGVAETVDGNFLGAFVQDISERKRVERMKTEFISTVSHELRTPMTSINASLSMLSQGMAGELAPDVRMLIDIASQSSERMVRLVNDILDMEKIESGKMDYDLRAQPLAPLLRQALDAVAGNAAARRVSTVLDDQAPDALVLADHDRIIQVFINLLSNAIKFSLPEGVVTVRVERRAQRVSIAVCDQGSGIPPAFHDRIFQKFAQADSSDSRSREGTGLGLSICKGIVEQHGGAIFFTSQPGEGTQFFVELPMPPQAP